MKVRVRVLYESPGQEQEESLRLMGGGMTSDAGSVRVYAEANPKWLVVEFTMPTEPQYAAVTRIDRAIRLYGSDRLDSTIDFPKTPAELARAARKAMRLRERRRAKASESTPRREKRP